jgi:RNA polymerase sigma factor (sigma-70 family)
MTTSSMTGVLQHLRRAALTQDGFGALTSGQLLEMFLKTNDEAAFETLLRRHGPMVLGVCRRLLSSETDAEDAFQSTFLVLVRKASSVFPRDMVANWLYGVARLTALKLKASLAKKCKRERQVADMPQPQLAPSRNVCELHSIIDDELSRLPERCRAPVILCDLEGKTRKEAARQLGWPEGSLSSRLSRARAILAKRLAKHGLAESAAPFGLFVEGTKAFSSVPPTLIVSTLRATKLFAAGQAASKGLISAKVAVLSKKVLYALLAAKLKKSLLLFCVASLIITGAGWSARATRGAGGARGSHAKTIPSNEMDTTTVLDTQEEKTLGIELVAQSGRVVLQGSMVSSETVKAEGNRVIVYTAGSTKAFFVDGKGTEVAKLETQKRQQKQSSSGPQKMYIASGPIQIDKADSEANGLGIVRLQSGQYRISATAAARSEAIHQLEFSAKNNRLSIAGTLRGTKFSADADRAHWDYDKNLLTLESKNETSGRIQRRPNTEWVALRARKVLIWLQTQEVSFQTEGSPGQ